MKIQGTPIQSQGLIFTLYILDVLRCDVLACVHAAVCLHTYNLTPCISPVTDLF